MHTNITKENLENIMQQQQKNNMYPSKTTQNTQKRTAFSTVDNIVHNRQINNGKQGIKKQETVKQETTKVVQRNNFQMNPQIVLNQQTIPQNIQINNNKLPLLPNNLLINKNKIVEPNINKEKHYVDESEDVEDEDDMLDMSISVDDMSNMSLENIDEFDQEDPTCVPDLVNEIYNFLRMKETSEAIETNYFENVQKDINPKMRSILIDWLVDVHLKFKLLNDTLFMTVCLIDRFLAKESVSRKKLQLVGVTCMLIASKFEEIYAPEVGDFVYICDKAYTKEEILQYEVHVLNTLSFEISHPTSLHFLRRFSKAAKSDSKAHTLSKYLIELALMDFDMQIKPFTPSMIAAASIYITRKMTNPKLYWNSTLRHYTQYKESEILDCARTLNELLKKTQKGGTSLNAIHRKYSSRYFGVANIPYVEL